jgi:regulator of replication initiation timing
MNSFMDQEILKSSLNGLERKIMILLNDHKSLKDEIRTLKLENHELRTDLRKRDEQLSNFKNQIKITKIVDNINPDTEGVAELKRKVEEYIREIDKCIAHVSR